MAGKRKKRQEAFLKARKMREAKKKKKGNAKKNSNDEERNEKRVTRSTKNEEIVQCDKSINEICCQNCHRYNIEVVVCKKDELHWRKYRFLGKKEEHFNLCYACERYLKAQQVNSNDASVVWQPFVGNFLSCDEKDITNRWRLIPSTWRSWWLPHVSKRFPQTNFSSFELESCIIDGTKGRKTMLSMLQNLEETSWLTFKQNWEKHGSIPHVRCPWGCSEYLANTNHIPMDVFFEFVADKEILTHTPEKNKQCSVGFRKGVGNEKIELFGNKDWLCLPTIAVIHDEPKILCCRYHSEKTKQRYIHPPSSPISNLSFEGDNSLAPVCAVPRTIKSFKAKTYTNSYHLNKVMGNYSGVDSINLTDQTLNSAQSRIDESLRKDALAARGRKDYKNFITRKSKKEELGWEDSINHILEKSDQLWTEDEFQRVKKKHLKGATYMPIEQAFEVDYLLRTESKKEIIKIFGGDRRRHEIASFMPRWPRRIVHILEPLSSHGTKPFYCKTEWDGVPFVRYLVNIVHLVPSLWKSLDENVTHTTSWEGFVLTHVTIKALPHMLSSAAKGNPFTSKSVNNETKFVQRLPTKNSVIYNAFEALFKEHETVAVLNDIERFRFEVNDKINVVIVCQRTRILKEYPTLPGISHSDWSEVVVGCSDCIYSRHNDNEERKFWEIKKQGQSVSTIKTDLNCNQIATVPNINTTWKIVVHARKRLVKHNLMRIKVLQLQGGQTDCTCENHKDYLVEAPRKFGKCSFKPTCSRKVHFRCEKKGCNVGICKICLDEAKKNKRENEYYALKGDEEYEELDGNDDNDDDSTFVDEDTQEDVFSVESLASFNQEVEDDEDAIATVLDLDNIDDNDDDENKMLYYEEQADDVGLDVVEDLISEDDEDSDLEDFVITTNCGRVNKNINIASLAREGKLVGNHVLLNSSGSSLLRRDNKLRGSRAQRNFLQRLVASNENESVPLIYPEAMLFPNYFWCEQDDCSVVGAIPNACLKDNATLKSLGIASLLEMLRTRILDPTLDSHANAVYQFFAWDMLANLGLRGSNTEIVLRRGWAHQEGNEGIRMSCQDDPVYDEQAIDTRATVNQLAAANARQPVDFFFTWTNNQKETFGCRKISEWIESEEAIEMHLKKYQNYNDRMNDEHDVSQIKRSLQTSSATMSFRTWLETIKVFLKYIQFGKDSPFKDVGGGIKDIFNRLEIQEGLDSKFHHNHTLLYLHQHPKTKEEAIELLNLIRGSIETFVTEQEKIELVEKGFVEGNCITEFLLDMQNKLKHNCTKRCFIPVRNRSDENKEKFERRCKQPDNMAMNPDRRLHYFYPIDVKHSKRAAECMQELGFIEVVDDTTENKVSIKPCEKYKHLFESTRHVPPCYSLDGRYSPANPFLCAMLLSAMNIQYCTSYMVLRYLAKYIASVDKAQRIIVKADGGDNKLKLTEQDHHNTKITGNKIVADKKKKESKDENFKIDGRNLALGEMLMHILEYPTILHTFKFEYIPTQPMGLRPILKQKARIHKLKQQEDADIETNSPADLNADHMFPNYIARQRLRLTG